MLPTAEKIRPERSPHRHATRMTGTRKTATADPKGHLADSPAQIPRTAWKDIASRTWQRTWDDNVGLVAAGVAFYGFFALLSLLAMIVLIYGLAADPSTVVTTMDTLTDVLPNDVAALIGDQLIQAVRSSEGRKGFGPSAWRFAAPDIRLAAAPA